jgi:hypothetical protein
MTETPLAADLLPSINAMAIELFGEANPSTVRRVRHLIEKHGLPYTKRGGRIESRRSWLREYYAQPTGR